MGTYYQLYNLNKRETVEFNDLNLNIKAGGFTGESDDHNRVLAFLVYSTHRNKHALQGSWNGDAVLLCHDAGEDDQSRRIMREFQFIREVDIINSHQRESNQSPIDHTIGELCDWVLEHPAKAQAFGIRLWADITEQVASALEIPYGEA